MRTHKLRILFLVLEMDFGGLQRMVNLLIRRLDKEEFEPYLVCLDRGGVFHEQTANLCAGSYILERRPGPFDSQLFWRLVSLLRKNKIDIIHSHNGCSSYAVLAGKLAGVKSIIHTDHGRLVPDKKSAQIEDRLSSCFMDKFIGVSEDLSEYLGSTIGINRKRTASERSELRSILGLGDQDKVIGTVCRLDPVKNLEFMISCIPSIVNRIPDAKLIIVGDGPAGCALKLLVDKLQLKGVVSFLGQKENVENILPAFDVYACSSLSEGTSMTILEAMACGLPIVASAVGGNVRLVDHRNGVLFPLGDHTSFIQGVVSILQQSERSLRLGAAGRAIVEADLNLSSCIRRYDALYHTVCSVKNAN